MSYDEIFREHRGFLFGVCYRMMASAADAEDLVQQTFERALSSPPRDRTEPWRPWLVAVAMNLSRDLLRRRKRASYVGPWLPAPIETGDEASPPAYEPTIDESTGATTEGRYDLLETVSFAFLLALEALTPKQRAVLLLRDVFEYSVRETAEALALSEPNVKTTHHRARKAMDAYDRARCIPTRALQASTRAALESFVLGLMQQDVAAIERLLVDSVRALSDGGGEFFAARVPVIGKSKVARMYLKLTREQDPGARFAMRMLNGLPALVIEYPAALPPLASRLIVRCDVDAEGRIATIYSVQATPKIEPLFSQLRW